ncbi:hypothetical protein [Jiella avicenniae]|uniref:Uncharacterized protein n=1 Tax=Jiella avicenniae TaxID=2907202 RepID=A0A9X1NVN9_9HYPH|nr:hypothetical protein [Jiella avicenniae]MCE7026535.1 hypothetical protein [Jiella avicenniae]
MPQPRCEAEINFRKWSVRDLAKWKLAPSVLGGGKDYLFAFKDEWVRYNRAGILAAAKRHDLPPELVAGVAWIEVAGDPTFIDRLAFEVRTVVSRAGETIDGSLGVSKPPEKTSFGSVSMQLEVAAETIGAKARDMDTKSLRQLGACLEHDGINVDLAARHLSALADHDGFARPLTVEDARVVATRYNRGKEPTRAEITKNASYGDAVVRRYARMRLLLR